MYVVYCQNKPKSEHIVSEYIDTYFEVGGCCLNAEKSDPDSFQTVTTLCSLFDVGPEAEVGPQAADHRFAH